MAVCQARGVQARPGRVPRRGFAANGAAFLWRTLCAATGGTGFGAGPRFHGARGGILWRTLCAATGGTGLAQGVQNAETVAANIVRHGRSSGEGRTGPAGTCAPPRFHGERARIFVAHNVRRYGGYGVGAGPRPCGGRVRIFVAHAVRRYRGTGFGAGPRFHGARVRILWRTMCAATGRRVCGARGGAGFFPHRSRFHCTLPRWSSGGAQVEFR